ncbi:MAG: hypothetical protein HY761_06110 [Candidatus Omnitrophica bacterium]|nr:hypothetical protein [Candidatus Omnitrophota bacterium]
MRTHYYKASLAKVVDAATEAISDVNNCVVEDVDSIDDSHVLIIAVYLNEKKVKYVIWIGIAEFSKDNINVDVFSRSDSGISSEHGRIAKDFFERLDNLLGVPARSSLQKTSSP